jgi:phosphomannomutase
MAEAVARRGQSVKQQLDALFKKVGAFYPVRINLRLEPNVQKRLLEKLKRDWDELDTQKVVKIDRTDGLKMILADGAWVLMRPSGTEPVVRVYCEAASPAERDRLAAAAQAFVQNS